MLQSTLQSSHHAIRGGGQNGAAGTCAGTGNGACPETDAEGSCIKAAPPSAGADAVVVVVAAPCDGKCLPPPWPRPLPRKGGDEPSSLGPKWPRPPPLKGLPPLLPPPLYGDCPICRIAFEDQVDYVIMYWLNAFMIR